ncbi:MAG: carboxypeptidase regulatory-like domain-containing protein [Terriglobales bacterium]
MPWPRQCSRFFFLASVAAALALSLPAWGQYRASVQGAVLDPTGAAIPGAQVTVRNPATGVSRTAVTGRTGFYAVTALPPGTYTVTARAKNFAPHAVPGIVISGEQTKSVDLQLKPSAITQVVTVTSAPPALQTNSADIGQTITGSSIRSLPTFSRDPYEALMLAPGVFGDNARSGNGNSSSLPNSTGPGGSNLGIFQTENQIPITSDGQRMSYNDYLVDGVPVNSFAWGGAAVVTPNEASIQSMQIVSNGYSAQYGRNSGAHIEVITRSGTNQFHGSADFTYQSQGLNAYNGFTGLGGPQRVDNNYRQFAGSLGGPILKNKLFFFASYEGLRNSTTQFTDQWVFTPQYVAALQSLRPGSIAAKVLGASDAKPNVLQVLPANCTGFAANTCQAVPGGLDLGSITGAPGTYVDSFSTSNGGGFDDVPDIEDALVGLPGQDNGNQYNFRLDYDLSPADTIAGEVYLTYLDTNSADAASGGAPMGTLNLSPLNSTGLLLWNHIFSPTVLNQARLNFTRFAYNQVNSNPTVNWGIPNVQIQGFPFGRVEFGPPYGESTPGILTENTFAFNDVLSEVTGNQVLKYGAGIEADQGNNNDFGGDRPQYVFQGPWDLANSAPIYEAIDVTPATGAPAEGQRYYREGDYAAFVQDNWSVRPNFTLNLGLRWEYFSPLTEKNGILSNVIPGSAGLANAALVPVPAFYSASKLNFEPRLGFAYSPDSRTVVHAGFGIFDNRAPEAMFDSARQNPPFFASLGICCGTASTPFVGGQILYALGANSSPTSYPVNPLLAKPINPATGSISGLQATVYGTQPVMPTNYVEEWSFDVEHDVANNWTLDLGYQGSAGRHGLRLVYQNYLFPIPAYGATGGVTNTIACPTCIPAFGLYESMPDANSSYNAFLATLKHTWTNGLTVEANYRYSKSLDVVSYGGPGFVTNEIWPQNWKLDYGPSDYNAPNDLVVWGSYILPFARHSHGVMREALGGWQIGGVMTYHSGFPWTPVTGQSVATPGGPSLGPLAPTAYYGGVVQDPSYDVWLQKGGIFPLGASHYFNTTASGPPGVGRNSFTGPRFWNTDMNFAKNFALPWGGTEGANLMFRADFFNIFNQLNYAPFGFDSASTNTSSQYFGMATAGLAGRVTELSARLTF